MSTPDPVAGLIRLLNVTGPQPVSAAEALRPQLGSFNTGDYVPAHVLATLPNGRFHVLVKDQLLDLNLPSNTQPGDTLELKVERNDTRLQFSLPAPTPAPGQAQAAPVLLSPAARLLQEALQRTQTQEPARLTSSQPLSPGEPQAGPLADNLRQAVRESGLFYESHQQQWVAGSKPLTELLREPQARLPGGTMLDVRMASVDPKPLADLLARIGQASAEELPDLLQQLTQAIRQQQQGEAARAPGMPAQMQQPGQAEPGRQTGLPGGEAAMPDDVRLPQRPEMARAVMSLPQADNSAELRNGPPAANELSRLLARNDLQNMVQQQIQALETHHLLWQGQVWPGQELDWEIVGERDAHQSSQDAAPQHWTSRLVLELPHLGRVVARVQLSAGQVSLDLRAEQEATAWAMREHQLRLLQQFSDAQLALTSTHIEQGSQAGEGDGEL